MAEQSETNYAWFKENLPKLLNTHRGQHALIHNQRIDRFYGTSMDAVKAGMEQFGEGCFSVELVNDTIEDLGFYSHVGSALYA